MRSEKLEMDFPVQVVALNGGKITGKTRFQKTVYLLQRLLRRDLFNFDYHYFGPFSEDLAEMVDIATAKGKLCQEAKTGFYSMPYVIFSTAEHAPKKLLGVDADRVKGWLARLENTDAISLELAATRLYLASFEEDDEELDDRLKQLKPQKASAERLKKSKKLLEQLGL